MLLNENKYISKSESIFMRFCAGFITMAVIFIVGGFGVILFNNFLAGISILALFLVCYLFGCFWAWKERKENKTND